MRFTNDFMEGAQFLLTYLGKRTFCAYRPLVVMIEPTNICNLRCVMCPNEQMTGEKGYMSFDFYKKIIDANHKYIHCLELYLVGEPLLHPHISEMIRYARKHKIWTRVYTNATLLTEEISKKLVGSGLNSLALSYEGLNKEGYEKIRRGASYEKVLGNIQRFILTRRSLKSRSPFVTIKFIDFDFTKEEIKKFTKEMRSIGVDSVDRVPVHGWPDDQPEEGQTSGSQNNGHKYYPCFMPWVVISVSWNGMVLGCCDDFNRVYPIGNLLENPDLSRLWNDPKMVDLRAKLAKKEYGDLPHCQHCDRVWKPPFKNAIVNNVIWSLRDRLRMRV